MEEEKPMAEQLPSARGLIDTDSGPLRRFTGVLDSFPGEPQTYNEGQANERKSMQRSYNFKDLEVVEAVEPYQFPIYTIKVTESNRKKSRYGILSTSLTDILDQTLTDEQKDPSSPSFVPPKDRLDWKDCIGKRMGLVLADGEDGRPAKHDLFDGRAVDEAHPKGQDMPTATWEVYFIEGIGTKGSGGVSPLDKAIELLGGKTVSQFNQAALANDLVRGDVQLLQAIGMPVSAPNSFTNQMLAAGQFTKDQTGVFHKVQAEAPAPAPTKAKGKK